MERCFEHEREEAQALEDAPCVEPYGCPGSSRSRCTSDGYIVHADLPSNLPVTSDEIALLKAFLHDEIRAILNGEDEEG